jgi:hypothetical protein
MVIIEGLGAQGVNSWRINWVRYLQVDLGEKRMSNVPAIGKHVSRIAQLSSHRLRNHHHIDCAKHANHIAAVAPRVYQHDL